MNARRAWLVLLVIGLPACGSCDDNPSIPGPASDNKPHVSWDGGGIRHLRHRGAEAGGAPSGDAAPD